jgi:hypothetical protein
VAKPASVFGSTSDMEAIQDADGSKDAKGIRVSSGSARELAACSTVGAG